jgi:hypothetical protein
MSLYHVEITGSDRRQLTALAPQHRGVVVGYRANPKTGRVVVDAYLGPAEQRWLEKQGYAV